MPLLPILCHCRAKFGSPVFLLKNKLPFVAVMQLSVLPQAVSLNKVVFLHDPLKHQLLERNSKSKDKKSDRDNKMKRRNNDATCDLK